MNDTKNYISIRLSSQPSSNLRAKKLSSHWSAVQHDSIKRKRYVHLKSGEDKILSKILFKYYFGGFSLAVS